MHLRDVKLIDLKMNGIYEDIKSEILTINNYAGIDFKEILEIINTSDELKKQTQYSALYKKDEFIRILRIKIVEETLNRIKSGEIDIIKKAISPYDPFLNSAKNKYQAIEIIIATINNFQIENDFKTIKLLVKNTPVIQKIIIAIINENKEDIKNNNYDFTKNNKTLENLIRAYVELYRDSKSQEKNPNNMFELLNNYPEIKDKLESSLYAKTIKEYLEKHGILERQIYVLLLRLNIFDYDPVSLEETSNIFGLTKECITKDQIKVLQSLFALKIAREFSSFFNHPNIIYNKLKEWHNSGLNDEKTNTLPKYLGNLIIILNTTKEELNKAIESLSDIDREFVFKHYNNNYDIIDLKKALIFKSNIRIIVNKLEKIIRNPKSSIRGKTLYSALEITKEKLEELVLKLNESDQEFLKTHYDENFYLITRSGLSNEERLAKNTRLTLIRNKLRMLIKNPNYKITKRRENVVKHDDVVPKSLNETLNITKEALKECILKLSEEEQLIINKYFDEDYFLKSLESLNKEKIKEIKRQVKNIKQKIRNLLKKKSRRKTLYNLLGIKKEDLDNLIKKLNDDDQYLIKVYFDDDYNIILNKCTIEEEKNRRAKIISIRRKLRLLIENPDYKFRKRNINQKITLYDFYDISKELLIQYISALNEEEQSILATYYDENYYKISIVSQTADEQKRINNELRKIKIKIRIMINGKQKTSKPRKTRKKLYELLNISEEELVSLIPKLSKFDQELLKNNYDDNYCLIIKMGIDKNLAAKINTHLKAMRKNLRELIINPDNLPRENRTGKKTLYDYYKITKEELIVIIEKLQSEDREFLKRYYDDDYVQMKITENDNDAQIIKNRIKSIKIRIRKVLNNPNYYENKKAKHKPMLSLDAVLNIPKEQLKLLITRLPIDDQKFITDFYDKDFNVLNTDKTNKEEIKHIKARTKAIIKIIDALIKNPNYKPKKRNASLCDRLGVDYDTTTKVINMLNEKDQNIILLLFDKDNGYRKKDNVEKEITNRINTVLVPKLKKYIAVEMETTSELDRLLSKHLKHNKQLNSLNILELIITMSLATGENYSTKSISKLLGIEESTVRNIIKDYLITCKEKYNKAIDEQIEFLDSLPPRLIRKDNKKETN